MVSVTIRQEYAGSDYIWREDSSAYIFYDQQGFANHFFGDDPTGRHFISDDLAYTLFPEATQHA